MKGKYHHHRHRNHRNKDIVDGADDKFLLPRDGTENLDDEGDDEDVGDGDDDVEDLAGSVRALEDIEKEISMMKRDIHTRHKEVSENAGDADA